MIKTKTLTFHSAVNYGAVLQALALQRVLINIGVDNKIVNYTDFCMIDYNPDNFKNLSFKRKIKKIIKNIFFYKKLKKKYIIFQDFIKKNLIMTDIVNSIDEINNIIDDSDVLLTGSDQVWSSKIDGGLSDIYTLNVGNKSNRRISYAASIGDSIIEEQDKNNYVKKLEVLDCISVREKTAQRELNKILKNKQIDVNVDPTLLLSKQEWNDLIGKYENENEKYILAYTMDNNQKYFDIVNNLSDQTGYKVVYFDLRNKGFKNVYKNVFLSNPFEFINYIKNAEYVVTNSFHGLVFSLIFKKNFWIIPHKTRGSRMTDLLKELKLENRIVTTVEDFVEKDYSETINYMNVNKKINDMRNTSLSWLKKSVLKK